MTPRSHEEVPDLDRAVVMRLMGGLGNLLFQYLAGRALADYLEAPFYCLAGEGNIHGSQLGLVGIEPDYITLPDAMVRRAGKGRDRSAGDYLRTLFGQWPLTPVREPHFHFWPGFFDLKPGCLLSGYWQSPKYFQSLQADLSRHVDLSGILAAADDDARKTVSDGVTVSVHIRRGDYLRQPEALAVHGIVETSFYDRARKVIEGLHKPDRFVVFSDNPTLAREALSHWTDTVFMDNRPQEQDLALMTLCSHHIIANSSFSWWGATLNKAEAPTVIAPRYWFTPEVLHTRYVLDLLPDDWILV